MQKREKVPAPSQTSPSIETPSMAQTLKRFAVRFDISYDTAFRAARDGKLKTIRFGKRRLVPAEEIARVLREGL